MADKRKSKKRKEDVPDVDVEDKASKDEYKVAKWMKSNVPKKKTKFLYHEVEYFTGTKAVDALLESKFAETLFPSRPQVVEYLNTMLRHKFFHRALKVPISEEELEMARKRKKKTSSEKDDKDGKKKEKKEAEDAESSHAEGPAPSDPSASPKPVKERKKKKIRLEMHGKQFFEDCLDAYVWIYDPIPLHYWIIGTFVVLGTVGICLFPLWPPEVRKGVYYLSIAGAGFLCLVLALVFLRLIVFCLLWCLTLGRHHLWLLPNLTEDVGFFASFWPLYHYEYKRTEVKKSKKKKKDKDSDNEQEVEAEVAQETTETIRLLEAEENPTENEERNSRSGSESESSSQKSQTGKDFEIVDKNDVEES